MFDRSRKSKVAGPSTSPVAPDGTAPPATASPARKLGRGVSHLYGDDPVDSEGDRLERGRLAEQLARAIVTVSEQSRSAVVGLVGPWGSGKTSVLDEIGRALRKESWYVGHHNPWAYADYEGAVAGFFSALRDTVPDEILGKEWREAVGSWVSRLAPIGAVGGVAGVDASEGMSMVGALISGDRSPTALHDKAVAGLNALEYPILIVLDDLDRLEPRELLFTFKLVRLIGRLPNVYYLMAYDETTLTDVLQRTDIVGDAPGRAQQYLEKVVQVRLEIPPMLLEQQLTLINEGISDLCERFGVRLSPDASERLQQAWNQCLSKYMTQPRAIKRLFTQVDALWPEVNDEVDFVDFVLMTFLRTFERSTFDLILANRDELLGTLWSLDMSREAHREKWERWHNLIEEAGARHPGEIAALLAELFLPLRSAKENMTYGSGYSEDIRRRFGVGSDEHFERYVQLGVPTHDLSESIVNEAVELWRRGEQGPALDTVSSWMDSDAAKVVRKLERRDESRPLPAASIVSFLGRYYVTSMDQKFGVLGSSPDWGMLRLAEVVLHRLPSTEAANLVRGLLTSDSGAALAADVIHRAERNEADGEVNQPAPDWVKEVKTEVLEAAKERVRGSASSTIEESPLYARWMWSVFHLDGTEVIRELNWELIDSGTVSLETILGVIVPVGTASNGRSTWVSMGEFSEGALESLLGVERVLATLEAWPEERELLGESSFERREEGASFDARKTYARNAVERIRRRRARRSDDTDV